MSRIMWLVIYLFSALNIDEIINETSNTEESPEKHFRNNKNKYIFLFANMRL